VRRDVINSKPAVEAEVFVTRRNITHTVRYSELTPERFKGSAASAT
jgi:hypothetical protein